MSISFIDKDQVYSKQNLRKCPICKRTYLKENFARCDTCSSIICFNCSLIAGEQGTHCITCFKKYPKSKREEIGKKAAKIRFWAKSGYYIFFMLLITAVITFSFIFWEPYFFYVGLVLVIVDFIFGYKLFKFLSDSQPTLE